MAIRRKKRLSDNKSNLIQSLKGRISKILTLRDTLTIQETKYLMISYNVIDELLTSRHSMNETKKALLKTALVLKNSRKQYIKEHIVPLMSRIGDDTDTSGDQDV